MTCDNKTVGYDSFQQRLDTDLCDQQGTVETCGSGEVNVGIRSIR